MNVKRWTVKVYINGTQVDEIHNVLGHTRRLAKRRITHGKRREWMRDLNPFAKIGGTKLKLTATPEKKIKNN
tara:strand:+ start:445 stop:660 length:216 start_codon:yes stop_codon:yes gene_type:complete